MAAFALGARQTLALPFFLVHFFWHLAVYLWAVINMGRFAREVLVEVWICYNNNNNLARPRSQGKMSGGGTTKTFCSSSISFCCLPLFGAPSGGAGAGANTTPCQAQRHSRLMQRTSGARDLAERGKALRRDS